MGMERDLVLLRHGKSDWSRPVADSERPLKKRGRKAARRVGCWLAAQGWFPEQILVSPARRTMETVERLCSELGCTPEQVTLVPAIYGGEAEELLALIRQTDDRVQRLLLVGHNPGLEDLVEFLARGRVCWPADGKLMVTCGLAWFGCAGSWSHLAPETCRLEHLLRPRELPD